MNRTGTDLASYDLPNNKKDAGPNLPQMAQFLTAMLGVTVRREQVTKFLVAFSLKVDK